MIKVKLEKKRFGICSLLRAKGTQLILNFWCGIWFLSDLPDKNVSLQRCIGGNFVVANFLGQFSTEILKKNHSKGSLLISLIIKCIIAARKTDIIRVTEQILDAISSGDFEGYTYVSCFISIYHYIHCIIYHCVY